MIRLADPARRTVLLCAAVVLPAALGAQPQKTTLVGSVRDSAGHAVPGVEVRFNGGTVHSRTSDSGGFRASGLPVGRTVVAVRRLGFAPASTEVTLRPDRVDSLVLSLSSVAASLPGLLVEDEATSRSRRLLAGFWSRRDRGFGSFLTRDEIAARHAKDFVDLVRMMPSAAVRSVNGRTTIRFHRNPGLRDCPPQYWVDGIRIEQGEPDEFVPEDVEAVEVYSGPSTVPVQFNTRMTSYTCGAIVIWTRLPGQ